MNEITGLILISFCIIIMVMMYISNLQRGKELEEFFEKNGLEWKRMSEKRLTLGELKHQIREIQGYYRLSDDVEVFVRVNEGREYIDIDGEIIKVKE